MTAHVLLNLLNELRKNDKTQGLLNILSFFRNEFNKFNIQKSTNVRFYLSYDIKEAKSVTLNIFRKKTFLFKSFVKIEL